MEKSMQHMTKSIGWTVKPSSTEYLHLAPEVRQKIDGYLTEYPVKLGAIAKQLGLKVYLSSTLPRGTSGQIGYETGDFVIRINRHEAKHRQRFTLAHEISHYLLHKEKIIEDGCWSENVLLRSGQPEHIEYEANRLASDLIIPSALLTEATNKYTGPMTHEIIEDLASQFWVSIAAMEIKLQTSYESRG